MIICARHVIGFSLFCYNTISCIFLVTISCKLRSTRYVTTKWCIFLFRNISVFLRSENLKSGVLLSEIETTNAIQETTMFYYSSKWWRPKQVRFQHTAMERSIQMRKHAARCFCIEILLLLTSSFIQNSHDDAFVVPHHHRRSEIYLFVQTPPIWTWKRKEDYRNSFKSDI